MEALPLCNPQPLTIQHNEFSKHLLPSVSAWQPGALSEQGHRPCLPLSP